MKKFDVAIIGAGAAGLTTAYTAKGFKKSVIVIDKDKPGGECTWAGCVPSKALINQANDIFTAKKYSDFEVDTIKVMNNVRNVMEEVYEDESIEVLQKDGIEFMSGKAKFLTANQLDVEGEIVEAKTIFICTGSSPMIPPIDGLSDVNYLTNESFFKLEQLPKEIIVLGGGVIGVELSQAMTRIGVKVHLVEMADSILPREDKELTNILKEKLEAEGVNLHLSHKAIKVYEQDHEVHLVLERESKITEIKGDKILVALGRVPNIRSLDLEQVGIKFNRQGIEVNDYLQTSCKNVYAVGDVSGGYMLSHMANYEGIKAVQNAVLPFKRKVDYSHVSWCSFTSPELATAGLTEAQAREKYGDAIRVYRHSYAHLDRAKTKSDSTGLVKVIVDKKGKVLGCSIIGERAGEIISEVQVVKTLGINFAKLSGVIHPYPTYSEILNKISKKVAVDNLLNMPIVKLFNK